MGVTKPKDEYAKKPKEEKKEIAKPKVEKLREIKTIIRVAATDLDGEKPILQALIKIKGIKYAVSKAICKVGNLDPNQKLKTLTEKEIEKLEEIIKDPIKFGVPLFLANRRRDIETGKDMHLTGLDLDVARKFDIQRYVNLKTYRGWRHMLGQPVRGQRTRSSFREKGRAVGVMRKEIKLQLRKAGEEKEEKK